MAKKQKTDGAAGGGKAKRILPLLVLLIGGGVGAKTMLGGGGSAVPAAGEAVTTTTELPGPIVSLEPMTVSMADGRYVRVGLALQLPHEEDAPEAEAEDVDPKTKYARVIDLAVDMFGKKKFPDLVGEGAHARTRDELSFLISSVYDGAIEGVYFTEFVVQ